MSKLHKLGISKYVGGNPKQHGRIKVECSDFVVREIHKNEVCTEKPKIDTNALKDAQVFLVNLSTDPNFEILDKRMMTVLSEGDVAEIYGLFGSERDGESACEVVEGQRNNAANRRCIRKRRSEKTFENKNATDSCTELNCSAACVGKYLCLDRSARTHVHAALKVHPLIKTKTVDSSIHFVFSRINTYTFVVKKINRDTAQVASFLGRKLGPVSFAGNKDKKAITYQRMSATTDFMALYECDVFDIKRGSAIKLGGLDGNEFVVRIRDCRVENVEELKFLNYFGNQRFGKGLNNHDVGRCIVEKRDDDALELIVRTYTDNYERGRLAGAQDRAEDQAVGNADTGHAGTGAELCRETVHELYLKGRYEEALALLHPRFSIERHIMACKLRNMSPRAIFRSTRRESLMLYLHSYQSYLFNQSVNRKFEQYLSGESGGPDDAVGYVFDGKEFTVAQDCRMEDVWLKLESLPYPMCRGGYRKMVEVSEGLAVETCGNDTVLKFRLKPCSFATMALRELIGDGILL